MMEDETPPPPPQSVPPPPEWKTVNRLPFQDKTIEVLKLSKAAAEQEIERLKKRLERLRYGI